MYAEADGMIRRWKTVGSRAAGEYRVFRVRTDRKVSPRTRREHEFHVIECANWVNVIAITPQGQVVLVKQHRHGSDRVELEIPGGIMDPHDRSATACGVRELREETGYAGKRARVIGWTRPNPALMNNVCYTVLVEDCRREHDVELDHTEDMETILMGKGALRRMAQAGEIEHALVMVAIFHWGNWERRKRRRRAGRFAGAKRR